MKKRHEFPLSLSSEMIPLIKEANAEADLLQDPVKVNKQCLTRMRFTVNYYVCPYVLT